MKKRRVKGNKISVQRDEVRYNNISCGFLLNEDFDKDSPITHYMVTDGIVFPGVITYKNKKNLDKVKLSKVVIRKYAKHWVAQNDKQIELAKQLGLI